MSSQPSPPQSPPVGAVALLLLLACPLYILMLAAILGQPGGDPGSYGGEGRIATAFSQLYALIAGVLLWVVLGGLLLIGAIKGEMPRWAAIGAGVLYPLSGVAALVAGGLSYSYPGGWVVLVGPEGGFSPEELAGLDDAGTVGRMAIGPHVLRAETAAIAAAAVLAARRTWGDA